MDQTFIVYFIVSCGLWMHLKQNEKRENKYCSAINMYRKQDRFPGNNTELIGTNREHGTEEDQDET